MSYIPPEDRDARSAVSLDSQGRLPALVAWSLYILSIPSANLLVIVGLIVAYASRDGSTGVARQHLDAQIGLFWSVFWWTVATWIAIGISAVLSVVLIGIPFFFAFLLLWFLISVWFTVKSVLGLINLLGDRAP